MAPIHLGYFKARASSLGPLALLGRPRGVDLGHVIHSSRLVPACFKTVLSATATALIDLGRGVVG